MLHRGNDREVAPSAPGEPSLNVIPVHHRPTGRCLGHSLPSVEVRVSTPREHPSIQTCRVAAGGSLRCSLNPCGFGKHRCAGLAWPKVHLDLSEDRQTIDWSETIRGHGWMRLWSSWRGHHCLLNRLQWGPVWLKHWVRYI